jgi:hypothetical protein
MNKKINLKELAKFLVKAKTQTYASTSSKEIKSERPLHNELEFSEGDFIIEIVMSVFFKHLNGRSQRKNWRNNLDNGVFRRDERKVSRKFGIRS